MRFSRVLLPVSCCLALGLAVLLAAPQRALAQDYSKSASQFPNVIGPYIPRHVPEPNVANAPRIDQLMKDGKLYLSIDDAIALALENNLDLAIARYNLPIADTDILRAKSGSSTRGVASGIVQGTPGGGVGSIGAGGVGTTATGAGAGGTTGGAGGAGTGAAGLVTSTLGAGPAIDNYDPILTAGLSLEHSRLPLSSSVTTGTLNLSQHTGTANFNWTQGFGTGTLLSVGFNNQRQTSNILFSTLIPQISSNWRATVRQHLLSGFGLGPNLRFIRIAKNNREISDVAFRAQAIATVAQIQNIYWDLVSAYEDVRVKERSLALAQKTLADNKKQVEIGTLAPIEITRAQSEAATREQDLIVSQTNLQLQQLLMKNAVTRNLGDPLLATAPVVPTSTMTVPAQEQVQPVDDLVKDALQHSPDLAQSRIDLTNRDITKKAARSELLPTLDLVGWYGASALGGNQNPNNPALPPGSIPRTGYGNVFATMFGYDFPDYGVGLNITIPIRNRAAQADQVRSELEYRQAQMRLLQLQNLIGVQVRNAYFAVQQNRARVDAARSGRELAAQSLDAEQKKYALGASTNTLVLQAQRDLTQAESNLVTAMAAYEKSKVELDRVTGLTLLHNGIDIADAESGQVKRMPSVPGIAPRQETTPPDSTQPPPPVEKPQGESTNPK